MKGFLLTRNVLTLLLFTLVFTSLAQAQATRTWVSGVGDDANPCSRTAPCKTFAGAISKTAPAGEIDCLDPGGFGALTITKSITIDCRGTFGSVLVSGTNGIVVSDSTNTAVVNIRGVNFNGIGGSGLSGIKLLTGLELNIQDVTIFGFSQNGIDVAVTTGGAPATAQRVTVSNVAITDCGQNGIQVTDTVQTIQVDVNRSRIFANGQNGILLQNNAKATIRDSDINSHSLAGVSGTQASTEALLENNTISFNGSGVVVSGSAVARVSNNQLTKNSVALQVSGGTINSFQNNKADGNTSNGSATPIGNGHGTI